MHIASFLKVIQNPNFVEKKYHILYCFSWKVTFLMNTINFWMFGFIETKNEGQFKEVCVIGVKFPGEKNKKFVVNKVL